MANRATQQYLKQIAQSANKLNSLYTGLQTDFNTYANNAVEAQRANNTYNAQQAQIQRNWQESMSATAHQREVADLKAAGLNPILSAYGSGASVGSGATATSDNSLSQVFGNLANSALSAMSDMAKALNTNATTLNLGMYQADVSRANAKTSAAATEYAAETSAKANKYSADKILEGTQYSANMSYASSVYASDNSRLAQQYAADMSYKLGIDKTTLEGKFNTAITRMNNLTSTQVAKIQQKTNLTTAQINYAAQKYSAKISLISCLYHEKNETYREKMKTLTQEISDQLQTSENNVFSLLQSLIGIIDFF